MRQGVQGRGSRLPRGTVKFIRDLESPDSPSQGETSPIPISTARLLAEAADLEDRAKVLFKKAASLRKTAAEYEAAERGLSGQHKPRSLIQMDMPQAPTESGQRRRRGRPLKSKHPWPVAVDASGSTVKAWAKKHGYTKSMVESWYAAIEDNRRGIPRAAALLIEREFGIPATEGPGGSWKTIL